MKGVPIQHPEWPGIECGPQDNPVVVPIELCDVIPGQQFKKKLPPDLMPKVLTFSKKKPSDRFRSIYAGANVKRVPVTACLVF